MFTTGTPQRRGRRGATMGFGPGQLQPAHAGQLSPLTYQSGSNPKRARMTQIGGPDSVGLAIQGRTGLEHSLGTNPDSANPPTSGDSLRNPDYNIMYNGIGTMKFASPVRIPTVDQTMNINGDLNVSGQVHSADLDKGTAYIGTGLIIGGQITADDPFVDANFSITAGEGIITDVSDPLSPVTVTVTWDAFSAQTIASPLADQTWLYITSAGAILQSTVSPTPELRRDNILLGKAFLFGERISATNNQPDVLVQPPNQLIDFTRGIGPVIFSGLRLSSNGVNLSVDRSSGTLHEVGINYDTSVKDPNVKSYPTDTLAGFIRMTQGPIVDGTVYTVIDPPNYDVGGVITPIPGSGSRSTNVRIYFFNSGVIALQYGQQWYNNLATAISGSVSEVFIPNSFTLNGILICVLSVRSDATDLSDPNQARFSSSSKFGEISLGTSGTSTSNFQNVYGNSSSPQLVVNSTSGSLIIQDNPTPIAAPLFEVLDSVGAGIMAVSDNKVAVQGIVDCPTFDNTAGGVCRLFPTDIAFGLLIAESMTSGWIGLGTDTDNSTHSVRIFPSANATSTSTGGLRLNGGIGCTKDIWCNAIYTDTIAGSSAGANVSLLDTTTTGDITIGGAHTTGNLTIGNSSANNSVKILGGFPQIGDPSTNQVTIRSSSSGSISVGASGPTTGDITIGSAIITGDIFLGTSSHTGVTQVRNTTNATSTTTGALKVDGGLGVAKDIYCDNLYANNVTPSSFGTVTQLVTHVSPVTLNATTGVITLANGSINPSQGIAFTLNNTSISGTSVIVASHSAYYMVLAFASPGAGSVQITLWNHDASARLTNGEQVRFHILNPP